MSRIGKQPIIIPSGVEVGYSDCIITVKGKFGSLQHRIPAQVDVQLADGVITLSIHSNDKLSRSLFGLTRTLVNNMVVGVSSQFQKNLEIIGVGYRAQVAGNVLQLQLGFSHPVEMPIPDGLSVTVDGNTKLSIKGASKQSVGDFSSKIRFLRPPEPYKGKGIRYAGEFVAKKAGKAGKK
jgi:large subunit ribosomal protein L6